VTECVNIKTVQNKFKTFLHKESADSGSMLLREGINWIALKQTDILHDWWCQTKTGTLKLAPQFFTGRNTKSTLRLESLVEVAVRT